MRIFLTRATGFIGGAVARLGEILALEWEDLEGSVLRIRTEKHGPDRSIKLPESTVLLLRTFRSSALSQDLMFPSRRTGYERADVRRFWQAVRKEANVAHIRFHDLRHRRRLKCCVAGFFCVKSSTSWATSRRG